MKRVNLYDKASKALEPTSDLGKKAMDMAGKVSGVVGAGADALKLEPKALLTGAAAGDFASKAVGPIGKAASRFVPGATIATPRINRCPSPWPRSWPG